MLSISPEELPVRLAHRVRDLHDLPQGLSDMPSIRRVKEWYAQSFEASIVPGLPQLFEYLLIFSMDGPINCPIPPTGYV
jgi:hypothetical protein